MSSSNGGDPTRNCQSDYIGQGIGGNLYDYIKDEAYEGEMKRVQCKHVSKKTDLRCITLLNQDNISKNGEYCLVHAMIINND